MLPVQWERKKERKKEKSLRGLLGLGVNLTLVFILNIKRPLQIWEIFISCNSLTLSVMAIVSCTTISPFVVGCVGCMDMPEEGEFKADQASQNYLY